MFFEYKTNDMTDLSTQEELVLLTVGALHPDAYAYAIQQTIKEERGKGMSLGTIHTILYRMEQSGLLQSKMGGSSQKRGGRSKRLFTLTGKGLDVVQELHEVRQSLWQKIAVEDLFKFV